MSEAIERMEENGAAETVENKEEAQQALLEDRENAPAEKVNLEEKKPEGKKKGKKKKKRGVALPAVAVLLVLALAFGAVIGYGYGRSVGSGRLHDAQAQIQALKEALEEAQRIPVYNEFDESLSDENQTALNDLAGADVSGDDIASVLMGEDSLTGGVVETDAEAVVVAEYSGGQIMSDEAAREYSEQMTSLVFAGYNEEEIAETLLDEVLKYMVSDRVLEDHAKEMGLYELTEADHAAIEAEAIEAYNAELDFYRDFVAAEGMTEQEITGAAKLYLQESEGVTLETVRTDVESGWWAQKVFDAITADVQVDDAALQATYESRLAEQKESFSSYADDYEFAQMNGDTILYNLPGYRAVRMLLVGFGDPEAYEAVSVLTEEIAELDPEKDADEIAAYNAEIDGFYAAAEAKAQEVLREIQAGADFAAVLERVGEDEGMKDEALRKTGYYVSKDSLLWPDTLISAAMALENPGDISGIVRVGEGVCILEYVGEVTEGEVALADVRDALMEDTLESAKYDAYQAQMDAWLEQANAVYYPERMQ